MPRNPTMASTWLDGETLCHRCYVCGASAHDSYDTWHTDHFKTRQHRMHAILWALRSLTVHLGEWRMASARAFGMSFRFSRACLRANEREDATNRAINAGCTQHHPGPAENTPGGQTPPRA